MSNNIFSSSDDDIFEDYVEPTVPSSDEDLLNSNQDSIDKVFDTIEDSPFKEILRNSTLKVNFGEAFYTASYEWITNGYRESNSAAVIATLTKLTNGEFLYWHRYITSGELLARRKTIIKFLTMMLDTEDIASYVKEVGSNKKLKLQFSDTYFSMFFRSFYNIHLFMYKNELAVYLSLADILSQDPDKNLLDPLSDLQVSTIELAEYINDLYIQHFEKDKLTDLIEKHANEIFQKEA